MTLMFPLMMGWFSLSFSLGLSFYFIISNIIGIVIQGFISGWEGLLFWKGLSLGSLLGGGGQARQQKAPEAPPQPVESQKGSQSGTKKRRKKKRRRKR
jgi:hypothetical protein